MSAHADPIHVRAPGATAPLGYGLVTKIPRCPACWEADGVITPNPLALSHCQRCGTEAPARETQVVRAKITGISGAVIAFGFWLRAMGKFLTDLAESMKGDDGRAV